MEREHVDQWRALFDAAYLQHRKRLLTMAAAMTGQRHEAEDVLHDVFAKLLAEKYHLRNGVNIGAYLTIAVRNRAIDLLRTGKHRQEREKLPNKAYTAADPSMVVSCLEEEARLLKQVSTLPFELKDVLSLRIWGERTFDEIAELQKISKSTAHDRFNLALDQLRQSLAPEGI